MNIRKNLVGRLLANRYRICTDQHSGYEAQIWRWWCPFWVQIGFANSHLSIESARKQIANHKSNSTWRKRVVEDIPTE